MKVQIRSSLLVILLLLMLVFAGCDIISQRTGLSVTAISDAAADAKSAAATEVPAASPTIGEGIGGGALEDDDDDDQGGIDQDAVSTAIQKTVAAMSTNTPLVPDDAEADADTPTATLAATETPTPTLNPDEFTPTIPSAVFTELAQTLTAIVVSSTPTAVVTVTPTTAGGEGGSDLTPTVIVVAEDDEDEDAEAQEEDEETCLALRFVADVNLPDGTPIQADQTFFKQWYVQNVGSCRWETDFQLVELDTGEAMGAKTAYDLDTIVYPGQYVILTAQMYAPSFTGYYTGFWGLTNSNGTFFGLSIDGDVTFDQPFYVQIYVLGDSAPSSGGGGGGSVVVTAPPFTPGP